MSLYGKNLGDSIQKQQKINGIARVIIVTMKYSIIIRISIKINSFWPAALISSILCPQSAVDSAHYLRGSSLSLGGIPQLSHGVPELSVVPISG
jgi:hypothetical protein